MAIFRSHSSVGLRDSQIEQFITDGFIRLDGAFPKELADQGRAILWRDTGCDPKDPSTWIHSVVRLGDWNHFVRPQTRPRCMPLSINWLAQDVGFHDQALEPFRCDSPVQTIRATLDGMWTQAFQATKARSSPGW